MILEKLIIIDGNSLLNRAFYATPPLSQNGKMTNAVYGFCGMLIKIASDDKPDYLTVAFDLRAPTFRHKMFDGYKANRKGMPDELAEQLPLMKQTLKEMGVKIFEKEGFEADDIIGTLTRRFDGESIVLTGDKDALQLVNEKTEVWLTKKGISEIQKNTLTNFEENTGLEEPKLVIDLKALMGDSSDNIPGISGIGEKTALNLISKYKNLEGVFKNVENEKGKLKERLEKGKEIAELSYKLAEIDTSVEIEFEKEELKFNFPFGENVLKNFEELGFKKFISREDIFSKNESKTKINEPVNIEIKSVNTYDDLDDLISILNEKDQFVLDIFENIHISSDENIEYTINIQGDLITSFLDEKIVLSKFCDLFKNVNIKKIFFDYKTFLHETEGNFEINNFEDVALLEFICNGDYPIVKKKFFYSDNNITLTTRACWIFKNYQNRLNEITDNNQLKLYDVEKQVMLILFSMEKEGFKLNTALLNELSERYSNEIKTLTDEIYDLAGEKFNIASPKQLSSILYDKLGLTSFKKSKTFRSTNKEVLEKLADEHKIVRKVLEFRSISKLFNSYIEGLRHILDKDDKVHTIFQQMVTVTGRLSSTEPNLQNLPIRTVEGGNIRKMFIPSDNEHILVGADYSQIELRLMAHYSQDEKMLKAIRDGEDIHNSTAQTVFGVSQIEVTETMRRTAKIVNFGIIYGISEYGLSSDLKVSYKEANEYIAKFFESHKNVEKYINEMIATAKRQGYVTTYLNRRRYIPNINASNYNLRSFAERTAMNTPLQGSAADIIKIALINVFNRFKKENLSSKIILQVHDELVVDALKSEKDIVKKILKEEMENAVKLTIPLTVDVYTGKNWLEIG